MNTRHAADDSPFRQERYTSSPELLRGLLATCVAARVQTLSDPMHRKLVWWLQRQSWEAGGLDKLSAEIMERWPERFVTATVQRLGVEPGRIYSSVEVKEARESMESGSFMLRGEMPDRLWWCDWDAPHMRWEERKRGRDEKARALRKARALPKTYPASDFQDECARVARTAFAKFLFEKLCLDPAIELNDRTLWYFPALLETLAELHDLRAAEAAGRAPVTQIGAQVNESLEYALAVRGLVVIDGVARTGKSFAAKAWCDAHPGQARYVQVPSSNDDMSFYRALCEALGLGANLAYKALELRARIEAVLQTGDLLLVLDEGHYLWPQLNMRKAVPHRINWMLTQLVNMGVPVAVITTPQFTKSQEALVRSGGWSSEQLVGRIMHYERLPDALAEEDLEAVAKHWLPGADAKAIRVLATYARSSEKYLQGIESLVRRARFLAAKAGREQPTFADVASALREGVVPSDNALAAALSLARPPARRKAPMRAVAEPSVPPAHTRRECAVQPVCTPSARGIQPALKADFSASARDTANAVLSP